MAVDITDPFMAGVRPSGLQRGRGGFLRSADDAPYVSNPAGETVKTGDRKGEVKRLKYGSPSNIGRLIENDAGLVKYKQRLSFLGIGMDTNLAEACRDLVTMETDSAEFRTAADEIAVAADGITRSWLAADRGSHGHLLCETSDRGERCGPLVAAGEALGLDEATQRATVTAWKAMLADNGLEVLGIEAACVDDQWRLAGTLDRIVRTTKPLRFAMPGDEIVDVPAGIALILDIKFGQPRRAHLIQIASYAKSLPYDTETEQRGEWPWPIDQRHALIAHGDFGDPVSIGLLWVDVAAGREHGGRCVVEAKEWNARADLWSTAQLPPPELPDRLAIVDARASLATEPDQGADLSDGFDELWDKVHARYDALEPASRAWIAELSSEATRRNVSFHTVTCRTERSYEIARGLVALATAGNDHDELLRALLALVVGDVALFVGVHAGHVLGSLNHVDAELFAGHVDALNQCQLVGSIDSDNTFRLRPFVPA